MADFPIDAPVGASRSVPWVQYAGGVASLALMAGLAVWGGKLVMRDVSGVPIVRAAEGPMREVPETPGGQIADHEGLAVNHVAATGLSAPAELEARLAPAATELAPDDLAAPQAAAPAEAAPTIPAISASGIPALESDEEVQSLVDQILADAGATPLSSAPLPSAAPQSAAPEGLPAADDPNLVTVMVNGNPVVTRRAAPPSSPLAVPVALRPKARPAGLAARPAAPAEAPAPQPAPEAGPVPPGTPLIQLGAFDSAAVAEAQWAIFAASFPQLLGSKTHFVETARRQGKTFYRLRVRGFADTGEARRLCSALKAEQLDCIAAVQR